MPQSLSQIFVHIIFSTKYREPNIDEEIEKQLYAYLGGTCNELDCTPIEVGGYYDHLHILSKLSRKIAVMKLLEEIKKNSSKWIKTIDEKI
ncbi:MAG: IS200/IS605 family transposase [Ginsengibacter sp.]